MENRKEAIYLLFQTYHLHLHEYFCYAFGNLYVLFIIFRSKVKTKKYSRCTFYKKQMGRRVSSMNRQSISSFYLCKYILQLRLPLRVLLHNQTFTDTDTRMMTVFIRANLIKTTAPLFHFHKINTKFLFFFFLFFIETLPTFNDQRKKFCMSKILICAILTNLYSSLFQKKNVPKSGTLILFETRLVCYK